MGRLRLKLPRCWLEIRQEDIVRIVPHKLNSPASLLPRYSAGPEVIATRNSHLYHDSVIAYCRQYTIEIMDDVALLTRLREASG